jgi:8-oxo-dGTP diphosphatase
VNNLDRDLLFRLDQTQTGVKGLVLFGNGSRDPLAEETLICRRDGRGSFPYLLDVPGGGAEPGESPYDTFRRELKEEFCLTVEPQDIIYSRAYPTANKKYTYFVIARLAIDRIGEIELGYEGLYWSIMSLRDYLQHHDVIPVINERIHDYLGYIATKVVL